MNPGGPRVTCLILVAGALAGCLAGPAPDGPAQAAEDAAGGPLLPDGSPAPLAMTWRNCANHGGHFPYPRDALDAMLPPGFSAMPYPNDPTGEAGAWFISSHPCDGSEDLWVAIAVVPPLALAGDATFHYVPLRIATTNGSVHDTFTAWNFPVVDRPDTMVIDLYDAEPAARAARTRASVPGLEVDLGTLVAGPATEAGPRTSRGFGVRDGRVVNAVDVSWGDHLDDRGGAGAEVETDLLADLPPYVGGYGFHLWGGFDYRWEHVPLGDGAGGAAEDGAADDMDDRMDRDGGAP